jgi:hypothetical protein
MTDHRSREEFLDQVATWEKVSLESPTHGVITLAAHVHDGIRVRLHNLTRTFLRNVRLDILFEGDVLAADWEHLDKNDPIDLFPTRPRDWGSETFAVGLALRDAGVTHAQEIHGVVQIKRESPAMLTMRMDALRTEEEHVSDDDEVVLVVFTDSPPETVTARWRVTAQDMNDVFEGTLEIPVIALDWRDAVTKALYGDDKEYQQNSGSPDAGQ